MLRFMKYYLFHYLGENSERALQRGFTPQKAMDVGRMDRFP